MDKAEQKLEKLRKLSHEINELQDEVWKMYPPKGFILLMECKLRPERGLEMKEFYSLKEMQDYKAHLIGYGDPDIWRFWFTQKIEVQSE